MSQNKRYWVQRFCEHTNKCFFKTHKLCPAWDKSRDAMPLDWYCPVHAYLDYGGADYDE